MYNTYDFKVAHSDIIKQLAVKDMLFVYYQCPQVDKHVNLFIHYNLITYTLRGKKHSTTEKSPGHLLITVACLFEELPITKKRMIWRVGRF